MMYKQNKINFLNMSKKIILHIHFLISKHILFQSNLVRFLNNQNISRNIFIPIKRIHVYSVKYQILEIIEMYERKLSFLVDFSRL